MSKDVFLYELKAYIKFPVVLLGIWLLTAIGCGIAVPVSGDAGAEEAYGIVDGMAQLILYALFLFLFFFSVYRTAASTACMQRSTAIRWAFWARACSATSSAWAE